MIPTDISDAARECVSALLASGIDIHPTDQPTAIEIISAALVRERDELQNAVIAAVAGEPEACRQKVFAALRRGLSQ